MEAISLALLGVTSQMAQDRIRRGRLAANLFRVINFRKRAGQKMVSGAIHFRVRHPLSSTGPASRDTAIAGVEMIFVHSSAVGYLVGSVRVY